MDNGAAIDLEMHGVQCCLSQRQNLNSLFSFYLQTARDVQRFEMTYWTPTPRLEASSDWVHNWKSTDRLPGVRCNHYDPPVWVPEVCTICGLQRARSQDWAPESKGIWLYLLHDDGSYARSYREPEMPGCAEWVMRKALE